MTRLPSRLIYDEYAPPERSGVVIFSMNPSPSQPADVRTTFAPGAERFTGIHRLPTPIPSDATATSPLGIIDPVAQ
jgi:hypothetical protein